MFRVRDGSSAIRAFGRNTESRIMEVGAARKLKIEAVPLLVTDTFEFASCRRRNNVNPPKGCDLIVCWRHNWPDHPKHIEILELSSVITSLSGEEV